VLDFGVAKLGGSLDGYATSVDPQPATFVRPITQEGLSVGTVAYMSPSPSSQRPESRTVPSARRTASRCTSLFEKVGTLLRCG
jgi:hypothetical protein